MTVELQPCRYEHVQDLLAAARGSRHFMPPTVDLTGSLVILEDGKPLAAGGLIPLWDRCFTAWALVTEHAAKKRPILLHRVAKRMLAEARKEGVRRITAIVESDFETGVRWLRRLGFEHEGFFPSYGPGGEGDYVQMGWLWQP